MINILTLKVGDKYSAEYVNRLYRGIKRNTTLPFTFYCYTEDPSKLMEEIKVIPLVLRDDVEKQFYKIDFHNMPDIKGKCLILDIDCVILQNIDDIIGWDLKPRRFGCVERWWSLDDLHNCKITGGFQMFYQGDTTHLYNAFYFRPKFWQLHYMIRKEAVGLLKGEQNFVDNALQLSRSYLPLEWFGKYAETTNENALICTYWNRRVDKNTEYYLYEEGFDPRIKIIHFANDENMIEDCNEEWVAKHWY